MLVAVMLLHASMQVYQQRVLQVELEGNDLYSSAAILVEDDPQDVLEMLPELGDDAWMMVTPEGGPEVRYLAANHIESVPVPFHDGTGFSGEDGEFLAGASASLLGVEDMVRVGTLGLGDSSLLAHHIVIANRDAIARINGAVVVDGSRAAENYAQLHPDSPMEPVGRGVSRHTDIDVLSPVFQIAALVLMPCGAIGSGLMLAHAHATHIHTAELLGFTRGQTLVALSVISVLLVMGLTVCCLTIMDGVLGYGFIDLLDVRLAVLLLVLDVFALAKSVL